MMLGCVLLVHEIDEIFLENFGLINCLAFVSVSLCEGHSERSFLRLFLLYKKVEVLWCLENFTSICSHICFSLLAVFLGKNAIY